MSVAHETQNSKTSQDHRRRPFQRNPSPQARCIEAAGDVNAGVLLYQIQYRFKLRDALLERDGRTWAAQTSDCWCTEVGLTSKQYKRALRILKDRGLIEVTHAKVRRHHRWPRAFIRLTDGTSEGLHMDPAGTEGDRPRGRFPVSRRIF